MYIIGIDVGGTNTDAALLYGDEVRALVKIPTNHQDLFSSTTQALEQILEHYQGEEPLRLHLSTTLSTNAIVEGRGTPTIAVVVPGPGVNLCSLEFPFPIIELDGYIDHRGREVSPLNMDQIDHLRESLSAERGFALAVVGKFSQRNPSQEQKLGSELAKWHQGVISLGHRLSGRANFPRRIVTTYLNASVAHNQQDFVEVLHTVARGSIGEMLVLKADGGTMTLDDSVQRTIETILSGPAASIMGAQALTQCQEKNFLVVDIGGTTTDLAAVVDGEVLFERDGATISGYKTLVPAVLARSIGLGGSSELVHRGQDIAVGPKRAGTPVCLGGERLTPTDAAVALGLAQVGSKEAAIRVFSEWGRELGLKWNVLAKQVLAAFTTRLTEAVDSFYHELETIPLYTVHEVVHPPELRPGAVVGLGAPAPVFIPELAKALDLPWEVLPFCSGANAIGAAAAQATVGITLQADTELGIVTIPEMGYRGEIHRTLFFDLDKARQLAEEKTREYAKSLGYAADSELYIVEEESFQMVRGFRTVGQIHMVRTQLRPQVRRIKGGP
mgnify:CR=1 FL=1